MLQIKNTLGGGKPEGLYVWKKHEIGSELKEINESVSTLPYDFYNGSAVVLNGEIHLLGGGVNTTSYKKHYKWDGSSWTSVSKLPYNFFIGSAVVLNNEIHILGGNYSSYTCTYHYKFDGTSWTSVSTLPYNFYQGSAVVLDGEIHILGGSYSGSIYKNHYKFDGTSWTSVSALPYDFYQGSAVVLNNEIHILGTSGISSYYKAHYKWDGSSWISVSTLPYNFFNGSAVVFNNAIHILGGDNINYHYEWNGSSWTSVSTLPYKFSSGGAVVYNDAIHTLGSSNDSIYYKYHYLVYGYAPVYTFLDYIVSDKENAYPDGGEKGGYYYEKISNLKFTFGTFTPTSNQKETTIVHGLNDKIRFFGIYTEHIKPTENSLYQVEALSLHRGIAYAFNGTSTETYNGRVSTTYVLTSGPYWYDQGFKISSLYGIGDVTESSITIFKDNRATNDTSSGSTDAPYFIGGRVHKWIAIADWEV